MATTNKNLIPGKLIEASQTAQYTAINVKAIIDKFTVANTTTDNVSFSVNLVLSAGTASADNIVIDTRTIAAGETYMCPEVVGQIIEANGFLSTLASAASSLTIRMSGREIS